MIKSEVIKSDISYIRNNFYLSVDDEAITNNLIEYINKSYLSGDELNSPIITAYLGALETLKAKHSSNPFSKFKYVVKGLKKLNKAVEQMPDNLEVRFLRFAVLHNIPGVFGISDERENDLQTVYNLLLLKDYSEVSKELQDGVINFLLGSKRLPIEKEVELSGLLN